MSIVRTVIILMTFVLFATANGALNDPFLWKVTKGNQKFYLFGTMHLATPELQILPTSLTKVIIESDTVYTEVKMDMKTQMEATKYVLRQDKRRLQDILPPKLYVASEKYIQSINPALTLKPFEQMKVWGLATSLMTLKYQLKYPTMRAIDKVIYDYAQSKGKNVDGIEDIREQLGVMDSFSLKEQIVNLESTLEYLNGSRDLVEELKKYYIEGDSQKTLTFINSTMFQIPKYQKLEEKFMQRLLYDRNIKMAKRILKVVQSNPEKQYLFAFGVMHFLGEQSVVEYLESYGYKVQRVR